MNEDITRNEFKDKIKRYFNKIDLLVTQVPSDLRSLLLYPYMLYRGFRSEIISDPQGKIGFELIRRAGKIKIDLNSIDLPIESHIFGVLGTDNNFYSKPSIGIFTRLVFANYLFNEQFESELPKDATINVINTQDTGPIEVGLTSIVKITDCSIYWVKERNTKFVKHLPFVWIFGNKDYVTALNPIQEAISDFYSTLFGELMLMLTDNLKTFDPNTKSKIFNFYNTMLEHIYGESKSLFNITQGDEQLFQDFLDAYKFFLDPHAQMIVSQPILSGTIKRKADFCIQLHNNHSIYVEIEPSFYKPFNQTKKSQRLNTALNQVKEWKSIIDETSNNNDYEFLIIIGRDNDMSEIEKESLSNFNNSQNDTRVVTWDYVQVNIFKIKEELNKQNIQ